MKQKYLVWGGVIMALLVVFGTTVFTHEETREEYLEAVEKYRTQKNRYLLTSKDSPLEVKDETAAIHYYEPDIAYRVKTTLIPSHDTSRYTIQMSDGKEEAYIRHAYAEMMLQGKPVRLTLFRHLEDGEKPKRLFLPFTDLTNGRETYGGGRYLDVDLDKGLKVTIDFNLAYNPYCAYNALYSCPVPPRENHIDMEIPVGEKTFAEH